MREPRSIVTYPGLAQVAELRKGEEGYNVASVTPLVRAGRLMNPLVALIGKF